MATTNSDQDVFVGDVGTVISIDLGEDLAAVTSSKFKVVKPDNEYAEWAPAVNGTALEYTLQAGDIPVVGRYAIQPYLEFSTGWRGHATPVTLIVKSVLTDS